MKTIAVLGSTGSIGRQALDVAAFHNWRVDALAASKSVKTAEEQIRRFSPRFFAMADERAARDLKIAVADTATAVYGGYDAVCALPGITPADTVINSIVGRAGLKPTLAVIAAGKKLALANKETLVCAGDAVTARAREKKVPILPVDSEHSAIFQCLRAGRKNEVKKLILTASGGPFYGRKKEELYDMTTKEALKHPTWQMGAKITVDSASMMNKGFEVIEAMHLFDMKKEEIGVLVHRQSIVHSMVEFIDGTVIAQMSLPDMRDAIQYALTYPRRAECPIAPLCLEKIGALTFTLPDNDAFPLLPYALEVSRRGGTWGACLNGANEGAVALFLAGKIPFGRLCEIVIDVTEKTAHGGEATVEEIVEAGDAAARRAAQT
ncbi:MAG: 1-deoxy-D-xylulose-5-phosphate reductoisomerase [Clostridia bacterium]|nr:1-deoxy-D-xylulose-5-phosphate reductoisomerase [Clostridia bacterium]